MSRKKINNSKQKEKKYITLEDGEDFRTIASIMTEFGDEKMNHATARNQLISALSNLFNDTANQINSDKIKKSDIESILKEQNLNNEFTDMLYLVYKNYSSDLKKEYENEKRNSKTKS